MGPHALLWAGLGLVCVAVWAAVYALGATPSRQDGVARSLALLERSVRPREVARMEVPLADRVIAPLLERTRAIGHRLTPTGASARLARRLDIAGNPPVWTFEKVMGAKGLLGLVGGALGLLVGGAGVGGVLAAVAAAAALFHLPDLLVYNAGTKRQDALGKGLADALDMLTVCVEAGQGFDAALLQVARSVTGPVAGEFARVLSEIQMGRPRSEAFGLLGRRSTVPAVRSFVSALVQADRLGVPVAQVLREQTKQMRVLRRQRAEEKAQQVPVKILIPMLLCIFPALMIVVIGPGAIRIMDTFAGM